MSNSPVSMPFAKRRAAHLRLGRRGERLAARLLRELGLDVLMRNYRCAAGEIDIVARDGEVLCFVEVKTRRHALRSRPGEAVGRAKRARLIRSARRYLREAGHPDVVYRFDIVEILISGRRVTDARYWRQAFSESRPRGEAAFPHVSAALSGTEGSVNGETNRDPNQSGLTTDS